MMTYRRVYFNVISLVISITIYTFLIFQCSFAQKIVGYYHFPNYSEYNLFWGVTNIGDTLRIATNGNGSIYKVSKTGQILDSLSTNVNFNHGLVWDGTAYWVAQDFRAAGAYLYRINPTGQKIDSILCPPLIGGNTGGVGDIFLQGSRICFSVYSPDFTSYAYAYAYEMNLTSGLITDTIPLRGRQVQGIALKGDTILYVNDYFHTTPFIDVERIYAYSKAIGDTLFSFPTPDIDGDCNPRGLHWDGEYLWLVAERVGGPVNKHIALYKYAIDGRGNPRLFADTDSLNFGTVTVGKHIDRTFTISNFGNGKLTISDITFSDSSFSLVSQDLPDSLAPNQTIDISVRFEPRQRDSKICQLMIASDDIINSPTIINLFGNGQQKQIELELTITFQGLYNSLFNLMNRRDSIKVYLTNNSYPYERLDSANGIIDTVSLKGRFDFLNVASDSYYIVVHHLNSLETWSKNGGTYLQTNVTNSYNFTSSDSQAFGNNLTLKGSKYCIWSADVNQDKIIDGSDLLLIDNAAFGFLTGRNLPEDINGDNLVDGLDFLIADNNRNFISVISP